MVSQRRTLDEYAKAGAVQAVLIENRTAAEVARELEVSAGSVRRWVGAHQDREPGLIIFEDFNFGFYDCVLRHLKDGLEKVVSGGLGENGYASSNLLDAKFGNLAAAMDDEELIGLMERALPVLEGSPSIEPVRKKRFRGVTGYRTTLVAMRNIMQALEKEGSCSVSQLERTIGPVKVRLDFLQRVGKVHVDGQQVHIGSRPKGFWRVPYFHSYLYLPDAAFPEEHQAFYNQVKDAALNGVMVDLEANPGYGETLLNELARESQKSPGAFQKVIQLFSAHQEREVQLIARRWSADLAFLEGEWQQGADELSELGMSLSLFLTLEASGRVQMKLTPAILDNWVGREKGVTEFGEKNLTRIHQILLSEQEHPDLLTRIGSLLSEYSVYPADRGLPDKFNKELGGTMTELEFEDVLKLRDGHPGVPPLPFDGKGGFPFSEEICWPAAWVSVEWFDAILVSFLRAEYREAENKLRIAEGIPAIGEGWISEIGLLRELRQALPNQEIVHQARPKWLAPQSLDIFFPRHNIGIEYQGVQHSRPVERFGGEEAFAHQQSRDMRKRLACADNGCRLIEVFPGYSVEAVLSEVRSAISQAAVK